jgi:hypothetical protein
VRAASSSNGNPAVPYRALNLTCLAGVAAIHAAQSPGELAVIIIASQLRVIEMQTCDSPQIRGLAPRFRRL